MCDYDESYCWRFLRFQTVTEHSGPNPTGWLLVTACISARFEKQLPNFSILNSQVSAISYRITPMAVLMYSVQDGSAEKATRPMSREPIGPGSNLRLTNIILTQKIE